MQSIRGTIVRVILGSIPLCLSVALILFVLTSDINSSIRASLIIVGGLVAFIVAGVAVGVLPTLLPGFAAAMFARTQRLEVTGVCAGGRYLNRVPKEYVVPRGFLGRWSINPVPYGSWSVAEVHVAAFDEIHLSRRLIRVFRVVPIVSGLLALSMIPVGLLAEGLIVPDGMRGMSRVVLLVILWSLCSVLVNALREDCRSPHSIVQALKRGGREADREQTLSMLLGYNYLDVRPRDRDPKVIEVLSTWLLEAPTHHSYRSEVLRHLVDTDQTEKLNLQRNAILALEEHFREMKNDVDGVACVWYAAYLSPTAHEAERIWSWIGDAWLKDLKIAETWLRARIAQQRGDFKTARILALEARADYVKAACKGWSLAYEIDQIDRLVATLPQEEAGGT